MSVKNEGEIGASVRRWPRGLRLMLMSTALIVTVVVFVPAFILSIGYLLGFGACNSHSTAVGICSPVGRMLLTLVLIVTGMPVAVAWVRFLARSLGFANNDSQASSAAIGQALPRPSQSELRKLSFGQRLLSGRFESCGQSGHSAVFEGDTLTFWSVYAFQKGWLKERDQVVLVYQTVPFSSTLKLALAFWSGPGFPVRGVAARVQSASVLIAAACIPIFMSFAKHLTELLLTLALLLIVTNTLYLLLMLRAKSALREFINLETRT